MGRPTKLTDEAREQFLLAIRAGVFPEPAARHAGFSPASLYRYLRGSSPEHVAFRNDVIAALASLEVRLTGIVAQKALTDPRLALALLERRFPQRWARTARVDDPAADVPPDDRQSVDDQVVLDAGLLEALVPRLLEAGQRLRAEDPNGESGVERFENRVRRRPESDGRPGR